MTPKKQRTAASIFGSRTSVAFALLQTGITNEPISVVSPEITETAIGTFPSVTLSAPQSETSDTRQLQPLNIADIPELSLRRVSCCGVADVSGIEAASLVRDMLMFLAFEKARHRNIKEYGEACDAYQAERETPRRQQLYDVYQRLGNMLYQKMPGMFFITYREGSCKNLGERFTNFVKTHRLGTCTITPQTMNPNSANMVTALVWSVDQTGYKKFITANYPKE